MLSRGPSADKANLCGGGDMDGRNLHHIADTPKLKQNLADRNFGPHRGMSFSIQGVG
jgi:hypothetical protein